MKLSRYTLLPAALSVFLVAAGPSFGQSTRHITNQSTSHESQAQPIQMSQVPQLARDAA